jgi:hypothetical protein
MTDLRQDRGGTRDANIFTSFDMHNLWGVVAVVASSICILAKAGSASVAAVRFARSFRITLSGSLTTR